MYKNRLVVIIILFIISFFVCRYFLGKGVSVVETVSSYMVYPLLRVQQVIVEPISKKMERSATIQELENAIECLQKKYEEICAENSALKAMHYYADETKELRDFNKRYLLDRGRVGHVLARHFSTNNQFFLVDIGSSQGIKKDMVALYGNAIVGRVIEVYPWYCKVCLITDADCKVASFCSKKRVSGIHEGINDSLHTVMCYVSHLEAVSEEDDVLSSGEGLVFPKGFALGKVVAADKGELFYTIRVKPTLNFHALCYCTLISKEDI